MKILVTGGAGFLGSDICESLLSLNHEVIALDNLYTGSKDNINHLLKFPKFEFIRHDITFPIFLEITVINGIIKNDVINAPTDPCSAGQLPALAGSLLNI